MDSLTQIVLGAAVGEAVLGKKIGNRAIVWGGIAGTIPDLDVVSNLFMTSLGSLAFHRGISHSFLFCTLAALAIGWFMPRMYGYKHHKYVALVLWSILLLFAGGSIISLGGLSIAKTIIVTVIILLGIYLLSKRYLSTEYSKPTDISVWQWQKLFLWALITHPILDCFTTYGTQIFLPFSDYRVSFNNIAVADPLYTVPFLILLIAASFFKREHKWRSIFNWAGIIISSLYMMVTIVNKTRVNTILELTLKNENITFSRYMTTPTILNNILWSGIAETDSAYYYGQYSFFDTAKAFKLTEMKKNHDILGDKLTTDETIQVLRWFSNEYFTVEKQNETELKFYDLRFGSFKLKKEDMDKFVFAFELKKDKKGDYVLEKSPNGPRDESISAMFSALWERIKGE